MLWFPGTCQANLRNRNSSQAWSTWLLRSRKVEPEYANTVVRLRSCDGNRQAAPGRLGFPVLRLVSYA